MDPPRPTTVPGRERLHCNTWPGFSGDGGPATSALLNDPSDVAIGPDGSVYIADTSNNRIRRVDPSGIIHTVAGTGSASFSGDGGAATSAALSSPSGIAVAPDGTLYIADTLNNRIRRVGPDGVIQTVAGVGTGGAYGVGNKGYGGAAVAAHLDGPPRVRLGKDGSLYIPNQYAVDRVGPNGIFYQFAGYDGAYGFSGDGGPATSAAMKYPSDCAVAPDGSVYIADGNDVIRRVDTNGIINTVVGTPGHYYPLSGMNGPPAKAVLHAVGTALTPDGQTLYVMDQDDNEVMRVQPALPGFNDSNQNIQIASQDGTQVYVFDSTGRHLKTVDSVTGVAVYQFSYDSAGRLSIVYDQNGNETQILRDGGGTPTSIVAPFGQTTTLTVDSNGYLATITDPASDQSQFTYSAQGLMATMVDPRAGLHQFSYDTAGRLTEDQDPAGGSKSLNRTEIATGGFSVAITTALGTQSTYQTTTSTTGTFSRLNTFPDGTQASLQQTSNGVITTTAADGTITTSTPTPDPRFGMESPMLTVVTKTPSGLTSTSATTRSSTSSGGVLATYTEQTNLNGNTWTRLFNASTSTWTATSPMGRQTVTTLNANGQTQQISIPNVTPFTFGYDGSGHLTSVAQGTSRTWTMAYDSSSGYLTSVTDPLSHATSYLNDALGRPTVTTLPDTRTIGTTYDANRNVTVVTPPAMNAHDFGFTPVDLLASYTPPSLGAGSTETQYTYDIDRRLTNVTRPDGLTIGYGFDSAGRLSTTTYPQGVLTRGYSATTGQLASLVTPGGETLSYSYDGFLRNGLTWSGLVPGTVTFGFDSSFRMVSRSVDGNAVTLGYDTDNLLTQAGALSVSRSAQNGWVTGTTLGSITDGYTYDSNGMFASYSAAYSGTTLYSESVLRDTVGRITQKTETVQGTTHVWDYTYDATGRLTDVTEDGNFFSHYGYDVDDNRTTYTNASGTVNPTYDAQDRLTAYGSATYTYTANGELATKTTGSLTTTYGYDVLGNLLSVTPPSGPVISYVVDGENRRVGKESGGTLTTGFLYQDALKVVAQLDGSGSLVAQFVFGTKANVPDYFVNSSGTFRILSDHLGSPRLIVNSSTGAVAEQVDYDEFGVVMNDTSPGLTPFGFAGGLYDVDTGLIRFGARDYDAGVGRWTAKDHLRFAGSGVNLYGYVVNDPVDLDDPGGLVSSECWQSIVAGCQEGCSNAINPYLCTEICESIALIDETLGSGGYCAPKKPGCYCSCIDEGVGPQLIGRVDSAAICSATCAAIPSSNPCKYPNGKLGVCK